MKHKKNFLSIFVLMLSFVVLIVGGLVIWETLGKETSTNAPVIQTDAYYSIRKNATDLQVDLYKELIAAIEKPEDDTTIAGLVAQNFVADFFTFSNKLKVSDIGGLQFIDESLRTSVYKQAKDTIYVALIEPIENNTVKNTLEVETVTLGTAQRIEFALLGEEDEDGERPETIVDAIEVSVSWTYVPDGLFVNSDYNTEARIILVKNTEGTYYIVGVNYEEEAQ